MGYDFIIIGGGAAGYFAAINLKEKNKALKVLILEKTRQPLAKVRISGGGRCNVTHACFDPKKLVENYPRGSKELLGPFTRFGPKETVKWFESRGVKLKEEADGRMFPESDSSETIIRCFQKECSRLGVELRLEASVQEVKPGFKVILKNELLVSNALVITTGSSKWGWECAKSFGHTIIDPVPSLFTFNCPTSPLLDLAGVAVQKSLVKIISTKFSSEGPLLITHWGFSGPAILKLSAFAARELYARNYHADIEIDWQPESELKVPKNLLKHLSPETLHQGRYHMEGKSTFKYEFTTAGGVDLKEINFKTMESKKEPGLYFAGEILNIDGITGGFNFQNAWTGGWIISENLV